MAVEVRPFASLGQMKLDWLHARYHFSFADYYDPGRMGVGPLRVWNDDTIQPGGGFPPHGHRDMEIITYVRSGAITHGDHLGNRGRTEAGDIQVMSAGKGIVHSEFNVEDVSSTLFQIWIQPSENGGQPHWENRAFPKAVSLDGASGGRLVTLASGMVGDRDGDAVPLRQDAALVAGTLAPRQQVTYALGAERQAYLVSARGDILVNGTAIGPRDGAVISGVDTVTINAGDAEAEVIIANLP